MKIYVYFLHINKDTDKQRCVFVVLYMAIIFTWYVITLIIEKQKTKKNYNLLYVVYICLLYVKCEMITVFALHKMHTYLFYVNYTSSHFNIFFLFCCLSVSVS